MTVIQSAGGPRLQCGIEELGTNLRIDDAPYCAEEFDDAAQGKQQRDCVHPGSLGDEKVGKGGRNQQRRADGRPVYAVAYLLAGALEFAIA